MTTNDPSGNRLLARLPRPDYELLLPHLELVPLRTQQVLYQAALAG